VNRREGVIYSQQWSTTEKRNRASEPRKSKAEEENHQRVKERERETIHATRGPYLSVHVCPVVQQKDQRFYRHRGEQWREKMCRGVYALNVKVSVHEGERELC
jgi:hypothetical protein